MPIITISRGCFSHGKEIAEKVGAMLGYECISQEILFETSQFFHLPENKLKESIHDAPGLLDKIVHSREKFINYIRAGLLAHVARDNVVYHGYAGHFLMPEVAHVIKIRVIAEMADRIDFLQTKQNLSRAEALRYIEKEDRQRADWNHHIAKADMHDPRFYDIVLNIGKLRIPDACDIICTAARSETYQTTDTSRKALHDFALSCQVKAALQDTCQAEVTADNGIVHVKVPKQKLRKTGIAGAELQRQVKEKIRDDLIQKITDIAGVIPNVREVFCDIDLPYYS